MEITFDNILDFKITEGGNVILKNEDLLREKWWTKINYKQPLDSMLSEKPNFGYYDAYIKKFNNGSLVSFLTTVELFKEYGNIIESIEKIKPGFFKELYKERFTIFIESDKKIYNNSTILFEILYRLVKKDGKSIWNKLGFDKEIFDEVLECQKPMSTLLLIKEKLEKGYSLKAISSMIRNKKLNTEIFNNFRSDQEQKYYNYLAENDMISDIERINSWDLQDYIKMLESINLAGIDMKFKYVDPKNIKKVHDETIDTYNSIKQQAEYERNRQKIEHYKNEIYPIVSKFNWEDEHFAIITPTSVEELDIEGAKMHHCVGSYKWRVADGETQIYFLRNKEDLNTPFVTIEIVDILRGGFREIQRRAKYNDTPSIAASKSIDDWIEWARKQIEEEKKKKKEKELSECTKSTN